ncbi:hypothetical protein NEOLEDRAFT_937724 [Neolentinus lepideus HHB14362 ss-1]|uniref:Fungal-type protein kinase domain-containing protein n=1 Tax=Neolentinus lepideus HHB14362 ss-1 TaxID=1314782 RepID=A0A165NH89_9AGAM|nr:hypothetical protein NEOLEDRAFT_937724 [Neolentinus lepideus HHB14362 ss-1]
MEIVETQPMKLSTNARMHGSLMRGGGDGMDTATEGDLQVEKKIEQDLSAHRYHGLVCKASSSREAVQILSDMLKAHREASGPVESMERTGIWQFMSQEVLRDPARPRTVYHDCEMAFWVLVWLGMHHLPNRGRNSATLARTMHEAFHERSWDKDALCYRGGTVKKNRCSTI